MFRIFLLSGLVAVSCTPALLAQFPEFKVEEIDSQLKIGYAIIPVDVDGDKKVDLVVVDQKQIVWYQNPTWKKRVILDGKTTPDNVCVTSDDITSDGLPELFVGAGWKPFDTNNPGTLQWLERGKKLDDAWTLHKIPNDEPMIHRIRMADVDGDGTKELVSVPLIGRGATKEKNWLDGRPVRVTAYEIPKEPRKADNWKAKVLIEELHVMHNFELIPMKNTPNSPSSLLTVSYEGVHRVSPEWEEDSTTQWPSRWQATKIGEGNQSNPNSNRGASEIRVSKNAAIIATIEPWHGNEVVVYTNVELNKPKKRRVIDNELRWGHAIQFADLTGDGRDELIVGVRDNPNPKAGDKHTEKRGVRIYTTDAKGEQWQRQLLDPDGVAVEDMAVADLNNDGKPDIIAVGRATGNCRIYWNQGLPK